MCIQNKHATQNDMREKMSREFFFVANRSYLSRRHQTYVPDAIAIFLRPLIETRVPTDQSDSFPIVL
jgi:hypothetical protein